MYDTPALLSNPIATCARRQRKPRVRRAPPKQVRSGGGSNGPVTSTRYVAWSPITPRAPKAARHAAAKAAEDYAKTLKHPAAVKVGSWSACQLYLPAHGHGKRRGQTKE